ncbi:MAG: hypothetical protein HW380_3907 [Magnetococcales bacterium]|nr:hypothetical protein [Magnetococcales bacterium]
MFINMSERAAIMLMNDIEMIRPMRLGHDLRFGHLRPENL